MGSLVRWLVCSPPPPSVCGGKEEMLAWREGGEFEGGGWGGGRGLGEYEEGIVGGL